MRKLLPAILSLAFLAANPSRPDEKALVRVAQHADVVVVAEVVETHPPLLGVWSGLVASVQHTQYKVIEVLKGDVKSNEIDAGHYVVYHSLTADKEKPQLSPDLFKQGNRLILSLSREMGHGCKLDNPAPGIETFCSQDENYGAVLAEPKLIDKIKSSLKGK
jgi:hypothetical protein